MCFLHVGKMSAITYNQLNSTVIKNAQILKFIHNIFNIYRNCHLYNTVLLKRVDDIKHLLNIR